MSLRLVLTILSVAWAFFMFGFAIYTFLVLERGYGRNITNSPRR